jgi:hypothetical protein
LHVDGMLAIRRAAVNTDALHGGGVNIYNCPSISPASLEKKAI